MLTIIAIFLLAIFAMPLYGVWMMASAPSSSGKALGLVLLIVGCIVYFGMGGR